MQEHVEKAVLSGTSLVKPRAEGNSVSEHVEQRCLRPIGIEVNGSVVRRRASRRPVVRDAGRRMGVAQPLGAPR